MPPPRLTMGEGFLPLSRLPLFSKAEKLSIPCVTTVTVASGPPKTHTHPSQLPSSSLQACQRVPVPRGPLGRSEQLVPAGGTRNWHDQKAWAQDRCPAATHATSWCWISVWAHVATQQETLMGVLGVHK